MTEGPTVIELLEALRPLVGPAMMALFVGLAVAAYLPGRRRRLNEDYASIPLRDDAGR